jgi:hypothetical protein
MSSHPIVPTFIADTVEWLRQLARAINQIRDGKINSTGNFVVSASVTQTVVIDRRCGADSRIFFQPLTANAAAALSGVYTLSGNIADGQFTVQHANNAQTDRIFNYVLLG